MPHLSTLWPFGAHRHISEEDLGDLHGKVVIVTGGNSGIGYCTVQFLVRKGAKVYLATRNEQATKNAMEKLEEEGIADGSLHWLRIELDDPRSAKSAVEEFLAKEERLDILVNNAAKFNGPFGLTKDGFRDCMAINYLGHFILTENLLPILIRTSEQEGSDVRIINVSSAAHLFVSPTSLVGKDNFNKSYGSNWVNDLRTYGLSKLGSILHTKHLQSRLDAQKVDIICIAVHPGAVRSPLSTGFVDNRAMTSVYVAASPEVKAKSKAFKGAYVCPVGKIVAPSPAAEEEKLGYELYDTTLEILKELDI